MFDDILEAIIEDDIIDKFAPMEINSLWLKLLFTLSVSIIMAITYRLCNTKLTYRRKFNIAIVMFAFISTVLLQLVENNPFLSFGVLGCMSICRFRINTKDPRDFGFIFWAMAIGIASATGAYSAALISSALLVPVIILFSKMGKPKNKSMVVIRGEKHQLENVENIFNKINKANKESENIFPNSFELVYSLKLKGKEEAKIVKYLNGLEGIQGVNVLAPGSLQA